MQMFEYDAQEWSHDEPQGRSFIRFLNEWGGDGWQVVDIRWSTPGRFADVTFMRKVTL